MKSCRGNGLEAWRSLKFGQASASEMTRGSHVANTPGPPRHLHNEPRTAGVSAQAEEPVVYRSLFLPPYIVCLCV